MNSQLQELYGSHQELVDRYEISISHMEMDCFPFNMQNFLSYITENTVTRHRYMSNMELLTLRDHLGSPTDFREVRLIHLFSFISRSFCIVCLRSVYCSQCCPCLWIAH